MLIRPRRANGRSESDLTSADLSAVKVRAASREDACTKELADVYEVYRVVNARARMHARGGGTGAGG